MPKSIFNNEATKRLSGTLAFTTISMYVENILTLGMDTVKSEKSGHWKKTALPLLILAVNIALIGILIWQYSSINTPDKTTFVNGDTINIPQFNMEQVSTHDYPLISPLRLTDVSTEFSGYKSLKKSISSYIEDREKGGKISKVSVYLQKLNDGSWMSISGNTLYKAGSLLKVPLMICYLKLVEDQKLSLEHEFRYEASSDPVDLQTFKGKSMVPGHNYTLEEMLRLMIIESDNNATYILEKNIEVSVVEKVFSDLGLTRPSLKDKNYSLNVKDYSRFMRVLYDATYLKEKYSNYALKLLTQSNFKQGMIKRLPANEVVAHKFNEHHYNNQTELSESGIVYQGDNTYLLSVMTSGNNIDDLLEMISHISDMTYQKMAE